MTTPPIKYNPAFLTDEQLDAAFVVRHDDQNIVLKVICDNNSDSNQHVLIVGPRGIGKTMLTQRINLAVRKDKGLNKQWYPLVFAEESYEVGSAGEFWLESIFHLANQTGDTTWMNTYEDLRREQDDTRLASRALAQLMDFADRQKKRILLVVENLNMILGDQIEDDCAWKLRHTLMHEPRIMLLATATARFDLPENTNKAFFEMFKTHELRPLDDDDCRAIWKHVAGHDLGPQRIKALRILTGGNPRLLTIISHFGSRLSFSNLMGDLTALVDDHTDYFKSHLEALPATERKVYVALADIWDPALARDVAAASRLNTSKTSALLKRLVSRGAVTELPGTGRKKRYSVTERMYNIYYLMRRRGAPSERVRAAVHFMVQFYGENDIINIVKRLGTEACELKCEDRLLHFHALEGIIKTVSAELQPEIIKCIPKDFIQAQDSPDSLKKLIFEIRASMTDSKKDSANLRAYALIVDIIVALENGYTEEAETLCRKAIKIAPDNEIAWETLGTIISIDTCNLEEAEKAYRKAIHIAPNRPTVWYSLGKYILEPTERYKEAAQAYNKSLELDANQADAWCILGRLYTKHLDEFEKAENAYRKAIEIDQLFVTAWMFLGVLILEQEDRHDEAETVFRKITEIAPDDYLGWRLMGDLLAFYPERREEACETLERSLKIKPLQISGWAKFVYLTLESSKNIKYPLELVNKAIAAIPEDAEFLNDLAQIFYSADIDILPDEVLHWAQQSVKLSDCHDFKIVLASILARTGNTEEALKLLKQLLEDSSSTETAIDKMVGLFAELAAAGYAADASRILSNSKSVVVLETVGIALKMFLEEETSVAPEIEQIATDVLENFTDLQKIRHNTSDKSLPIEKTEKA